MIDKNFYIEQLELIKTAKTKLSYINGKLPTLEDRLKRQIEKEEWLTQQNKENEIEQSRKDFFKFFSDIYSDIIFEAEFVFKCFRKFNLFLLKASNYTDEMKEDLSKRTDLEIEFHIINEDIYYFKLPEFSKAKELNKRKTNRMSDYIIKEIMVEKIKEKFDMMDVKPELFYEHTLVFIHHYNPETTLKDIDNLSLKHPIDALNGSLIIDDCMSVNNIIQLTAPDETDWTELYIIRGQDIGECVKKCIEKVAN